MSMVSEIETDLQRLGYDVGPADGRLAPRTEAAIRDCQQQYGLPVDGRPSVSRHDRLARQGRRGQRTLALRRDITPAA
jgi:peptidoglycan hydrolase-like protein with peptidoglycan-binding domain